MEMENFLVLSFPVSTRVVSAQGPLLLTCIQSSAQALTFPFYFSQASFVCVSETADWVASRNRMEQGSQ